MQLCSTALVSYSTRPRRRRRKEEGEEEEEEEKEEVEEKKELGTRCTFQSMPRSGLHPLTGPNNAIRL
jgi:hypothetical protein